MTTGRLKIAILSLFLLLLLTVNGCQVGGSGSFVQGISVEDNNARFTGEPVTGDWVIINLLGEPESLNPYTSTSATATRIYNYIYEAFLQFERQPPWDLVPLLIDSMPEVTEDHLIYTWRLRRDIHWHDGKPMTMRDAEFSLKAIMNPYVDNLPSKPYYRELDSLRLDDDYTLVMYCSQPYFMHIDFLGGFSILPRHVFDDEGLLDDISYFQVKNGSAFGRIADLLESDVQLSWDELSSMVTLAGLQHSISSVSDNKIKWDDMIGKLEGFDNQPANTRLMRVMAYLEEHPDGASARNYANDIIKSTSRILSTLPLASEIESQAEPGAFPKRDELMSLCRDLHDRIESFGRKFNTHPQARAPTIGSGPYQFERWLTGQEIALKRNENYWLGEGHAYIDKLVWRILTDYTASLVALKNGEIDFMTSLRPIQYLTMTNRRKFLDNFVKSSFLIPSYSYFGWRNDHAIFKDKRVRRAMTHMVRRRDAVDKLLFGFAEIVTGNFYRYGPDYDSTIVPYQYDPQLAQQLLAEAGWEDVDNDGILEKDSLEFRFEMLVPSTSSLGEQLTSIIREDLYMIGIEMTIRRLEWSVFINNYIRNHNFDACYLGWVFGMKGDPKQVWHSESASGRGSNHIVFRNAEADSLIDAARVEFDQEKRVAMYHRFQQILHEEQPYTFLLSSKNLPAYDNRFKGVKWYPFRPGYQFDEWYVPKAEQKYQ